MPVGAETSRGRGRDSRQRHRALGRDDILAVAANAFAEWEYHGTDMERVADALQFDRLPGRPDRIANRVLGRLTETGPRCGRTGVRESDIPGLEGYARQFEEAIEKIRLSHQGFRGQGER